MGMKEVLITQRDHGRILEAKQGAVITIRLEEPFASGYQWEQAVIDSAIVEHLDTDHTESATEIEGKPLLGRPGTCTMRFRAKSSGSGPIQLRLRRPWEPEDAAVERFEVIVKVR
jgi:predicted secreted protein